MLWKQAEADRLAGQGRFVARLSEQGLLPPGLAFEVDRDILWTICSSAVYDNLVIERGWSAGRYEEWLASPSRRRCLRLRPIADTCADKDPQGRSRRCARWPASQP